MSERGKKNPPRVPDQSPQRNSNPRQGSSARVYTLVDLFCGAGGFTFGFVDTGRFRPIFSNDFNRWAGETYNANFKDHCIVGDINKVLLENRLPQKADIVIGGPPCQGFSLLNKKRDGDPRKQLWESYMEVVERVQPLAFVMENVPELLASWEFNQITRTAQKLGFECTAGILNAANYGVPQRRKRAILIGSRVGKPTLPPQSHVSPDQRDKNPSLPTWRTVEDAIKDLPRPVGTEIRHEVIPPHLDLHFGRNPTPKSLLRYKCVPEGGNRVDLQRRRPDLTPQCWIEKKGGTDLFGRLWWSRPSFTIRTEFFKPEKGRYLHPEQHRPITHREAARLMSFPDSFRFRGSKIEVARQIGNAVPPLLARRIAESVVATLEQKAQPALFASEA